MLNLSKEMVQFPQFCSLNLEYPFGKGLSIEVERNENLMSTYSVLGTVHA